MAIAITQQSAVTADCCRQESGNDKIGGDGGEDGLMATMFVAAPDDGIRSPSLLASAAAATDEHDSTPESMPGLTDESSEDTHLPPRQQKKETPKNKTAASRIVVTTTVSTAPDDTTKEKPAKAVPKQRAAAAKEQYKKTPWKKQYDGDHDDCWD